MNKILLRTVTAIIAGSGMNGGKVIKQMEKLFPIPEVDGKKYSNISQKIRDQLKQLREADAKIRAAEKINNK